MSQRTGEGVTIMRRFCVKGAPHANHNAGASRNHQGWWWRRWLGRRCWRHLLSRRLRHLLILCGGHLLCRRHLTACGLVRLRLVGGVGCWWVLALFILATGTETESE